MFDQKLNKNKKINSVKKAITALLIISMLFSMLQTTVFATEESLKTQMDSTSTGQDTITETNICEIIDTDGVTIVEAYDNFADALAAVQNGQTIRLLCDIEYNAGIKITNKSITFDLNGFTLNVSNNAGHGLEVGAGGELWLIGHDTGGKFNVKGNGTNKQGVYAHSGGKAEVSTAYAMMNWGDIERGVYATGAGTVVTVYGNVNSDTFYAIEAADGATLTVHGNALAGAGMIARGADTTITVYGNSGGGGTGVYAYDNARVFVGGNVIGGGAGVYVMTGAQVTVNGTVKATSGDKVYVQFSLGGGKYDNRMQADHEAISSKTGYFEYKNGDSIVWIKDPIVYAVRHRETNALYKTISEAIAAIKPNYDAFTLEVLGDVLEKDNIIINDEDVTIVSVNGNHVVSFASPVPSSGWKFVLKGGGTLVLGEGNMENALTILHSVEVTNGHIIVKDGVIIKSGSSALYLSGPNAVGTISGGRFEGSGTSNIVGTGLSVEKGAKIIEISGGAFFGNIDAVHVSDVGTRIEKISGGAFYQTDPDTKLHGHAIFVQNEAQIGEISGGYFEAARNYALMLVRSGWVDEISGGTFVGTRSIYIENSPSGDYLKTGISTISGGNLLGTNYGLLLIATSGEAYVGKITGGTIKGGIVALQNDRGGVIDEISGGTIIGSQGILNVGKIGKISGNVEISGGTSSSSYGIYNYYTNSVLFGHIGEISGGQISSSGAQSIANAGTINLISGGTIISSASYGITNRGIINLISGGTIIGAQSAIYCYVLEANDIGTLGVLRTITNGVFWGKSGTAIILNSTLTLEPGLNTNKGLGRYQSGNGLIFNNEALVVYPAGYYMSSRTEPVEGITDIGFRYLTLGDKYTIEYVLNGGINNPNNPTAYDETNLPYNIANPTKIGYKFLGWTITYHESNQPDTTTPTTNYHIPKGTTGDITLTAHWTPTQYNINYDLRGGTNAAGNPTTYTTERLPLRIAAPTREGYTFLNWDIIYTNHTMGILPTNGIPKGTTGDITLVAIWHSNNIYNIHYNLNGGINTLENPTTYTPTGIFPITINNPTKSGYEFLGWTVKYHDDSQPDITTPTTNYTIKKGTTGDITLTAHWKPQQYNIIYKLENGNNAPGNPTSYTKESNFPIAINNPARTGHEFIGWNITYANGTTVVLQINYNIPQGTTGDILLTATWKASGTGGGTEGGGGSGGGTNTNNNSGGGNKIVWYTVHFVDWDETLLKTERVRLGGDATAPNSLAREGYIFTGWDRSFTNVQSDLTVTAQYEKEAGFIPPIEEDVPVWALVNLVLSVVGVILVAVVLVYVLLQQRNKENQQKNNKPQNTTAIQSNNQEKQQKQRKMWLITALALGVAGIIVFLLTEDMSRKVAMVDNWTIVNAALFIAEIIAITLLFKRNNKDSAT